MPKPIERRIAAASIEFREEDGKLFVRGYAAVFDSVSHGEVVRSTAFTRTLGMGADVKLKINHDGIPLARTKSGTLTCTVDERGLLVEAELDPANPAVQELRSAMARGDIDQMSFAFRDMAPQRSKDGTRELVEVELTDVSIVTDPWYEATTVQLDDSTRGALRAVGVGAPLTVEQRNALRAVTENRATVGSFDAIREQVCDAICDRIEEMTGIEPCCYVVDIGPDWAVYTLGMDDDYTQVSYSIDAAGVVTLGDPIEVDRVVSWVPDMDDAAEAMARSARHRLEMARTLFAA